MIDERTIQRFEVLPALPKTSSNHVGRYVVTSLGHSCLDASQREFHRAEFQVDQIDRVDALGECLDLRVTVSRKPTNSKGEGK